MHIAHPFLTSSSQGTACVLTPRPLSHPIKAQRVRRARPPLPLIRSGRSVSAYIPPTSPSHPIRAQRVRKLHAESDNATFSGGEDNCDSRSHLSTASAPSHPEAGPSHRKRSRASDDSGPEVDPETAAENAGSGGGGGGGGGGRGTPEPGADGGGSEIELVFRPHPLLVDKGEYSQTR